MRNQGETLALFVGRGQTVSHSSRMSRALALPGLYAQQRPKHTQWLRAHHRISVASPWRASMPRTRRRATVRLRPSRTRRRAGGNDAPRSFSKVAQSGGPPFSGRTPARDPLRFRETPARRTSGCSSCRRTTASSRPPGRHPTMGGMSVRSLPLYTIIIRNATDIKQHDMLFVSYADNYEMNKAFTEYYNLKFPSIFQRLYTTI